MDNNNNTNNKPMNAEGNKGNGKQHEKAKKADPFHIMNREADSFFGGGAWPLPADELQDKK